jgi:hypothetical protein
MSVSLKTATDILRLCREVRTLSLEQAVQAYNALSKVDYTKYPPEIHDAAEDGMFFAVFGGERDCAMPLGALERMILAMADVDAPPNDAASASPTAPPAQRDGEA